MNVQKSGPGILGRTSNYKLPCSHDGADETLAGRVGHDVTVEVVCEMKNLCEKKGLLRKTCLAYSKDRRQLLPG